MPYRSYNDLTFWHLSLADGRSITLHNALTSIGRDQGCDLQLIDATVSKRHAQIAIRDGQAEVSDLASFNGTYVNGIRIFASRSLRHGDVLSFGEHKLQVLLQRQPAESDLQCGRMSDELCSSANGRGRRRGVGVLAA